MEIRGKAIRSPSFCRMKKPVIKLKLSWSQKFLISSKSHLQILLLLAIVLGTHWFWFVPGTLLTSQDWWYFYPKALQELGRDWNVWFGQENLGADNPQVYFYPMKLLWSELAKLGFSYTLITKVTFLYPMLILGATSMYTWLVHKIGKWPAFWVGLYFTTTTYFLTRQTAHLNIAMLYAFAPFLILAVENFVKKASIKSGLWLALALSFGFLYELRITLLVLIISILWVVGTEFSSLQANFTKLNGLKSIVITGLVTVLINLFWIIPTVFARGSISAIAGRGVFGNNWFTLKTALFNFDPEWTGGFPDINFQTQPIPLYYMLLLVPLVYAFYLGVIRKNKYILSGLLIAFLGVMLTKQASAPFPTLYTWLYEHIPGFNLFREASKFYVFTGVGYSVLLGYALFYTYKLDSWWARVFSAAQMVLILILATSSSLPVVTKELGTMFTNRAPNAEYTRLADTIASTPNFARTLAIPIRTRWMYMDQLHPVLSLSENPNLYQKPELVLTSVATADSGVEQQLVINRFIRTEAFQYTLENLAVEYIIVPQDFGIADEDVFRYFGGSTQGVQKARATFVSTLDAVSFLQKDLSYQTITVYKNTRYAQTQSYTNVASALTLPEQTNQVAYAKKLNNEVSEAIQFSPQDLTYNYTLKVKNSTLVAVSRITEKEYPLIANHLSVKPIQTPCEPGASNSGVKINGENAISFIITDLEQCVQIAIGSPGQKNFVFFGDAGGTDGATMAIISSQFAPITSYETGGELGIPCALKKLTEYCSTLGTIYSAETLLTQPIALKITANRSGTKLGSNSFYAIPSSLSIQNLDAWSIDFERTNQQYLPTTSALVPPKVKVASIQSTESAYVIQSTIPSFVVSLPIGYTDNWKASTTAGKVQVIPGTLGNTLLVIQNPDCTEQNSCDFSVHLVHASQKYFIFLVPVAFITTIAALVYLLLQAFYKKTT